MKLSKPHSILIRQPISNIYCQFSLEHDSFSNKRLYLPPAVLNSIMSEANLKKTSAPLGSKKKKNKGNLEPDCLSSRPTPLLTLKKSLKPVALSVLICKMERITVIQRVIGKIKLVNTCKELRTITSPKKTFCVFFLPLCKSFVQCYCGLQM